MEHRNGLDHLVVLASDLEQGMDWCEATLGLRPSAGGEHALMGTHNRIVRIDSAAFPRAYLEIIAIQRGAPSARTASQRRWFDMDDATLQARIAEIGPQLVHWVASVAPIANTVQSWAAMGLDRGPVLAASRMTAQGLLEWQITVRDDGQRLLDGCLPTLIQWGAQHPCDALPASGIALQSLQLSHPEADTLQAALQAAGLAQCATVQSGLAALHAMLQTPRGVVRL